VRAAWWWIDRWRKSTAYTDMTLAEQGAYRNLLDELWLRNGLLPNDDRILGKVAGDSLEWPTVRAAVMRRFVKVENGWRHPTHDEVAAAPAAQAAKGRMRMAGMTASERSEFGRRAAKLRWQNQQLNASQMPAECQPPSPSPYVPDKSKSAHAGAAVTPRAPAVQRSR